VLHRILGGIGRTLITTGTLILLFVAYELWGTGIQTASAQKHLTHEIDSELSRAASNTTSTSTTTSTTSTTLAPGTPTTSQGLRVTPTKVLESDIPLPKYGEPIAKIQIPKIGITRTVVEGVGLDQLKRGPGHYPTTPLPGQAGNAAIAGHRTTYGQPFHNVDKLQPGDEILVTTIQRPLEPFVYKIDRITIVKPTQSSVLLFTLDKNKKLENRITLTACHPKYSARQRIIVSGLLVGKPAPPIKGQDEAIAHAQEEAKKHPVDPNSATIGGDAADPDAPLAPVFEWGAVCILIWVASWLVQVVLRRRMRAKAGEQAELGDGTGRPKLPQRLFTWVPYVFGSPLFLVALYFFFENFVRLRDWSAWKPPFF
jgi:sortase A